MRDSLMMYAKYAVLTALLSPVVVLIIISGESLHFETENVLVGVIEGAWAISIFVWLAGLLCALPIVILFECFDIRTRGVYVLALVISIVSVFLFVQSYLYVTLISSLVAEKILITSGLLSEVPMWILAARAKIPVLYFSGGMILVFCIYLIRLKFLERVVLRWVSVALIAIVGLMPLGISMGYMYAYIGSNLFQSQWL